LRQFESEYYREPGSTEDEYQLGDTLLPHSLCIGCEYIPYERSIDESREAAPSLKGLTLHQEVYGLDGINSQTRPYSVTENSYTVEMLQGRGMNRHCVLFSHSREFQYEYCIEGRELTDPQVSQSLTISVDEFGNVLQSAMISYGRRYDDPSELLLPTDRSIHRRIHITYSNNSYTNGIFTEDVYRTPLRSETVNYRCIKLILLPIFPEPKAYIHSNIYSLEYILQLMGSTIYLMRISEATRRWKIIHIVDS
jgi:hypothetical protein